MPHRPNAVGTSTTGCQGWAAYWYACARVRASAIGRVGRAWWTWGVVAAGLRLAVSWSTADSGAFADMLQYHERAVHVAATGTLWPDAIRGPGYPAWLAMFYVLLGPTFWSARVANAVAAAALAGVTWALARRAGAGDRAWYASAIVALYPALVLSSVYTMPEGLYAFASVCCLLLLSWSHPAAWAAAGAAAGAAMLTRSVGLALVPAAVGAAVMATRPTGPIRRASVVPLVAFAVGAFVVLAPWLAFTKQVVGGYLLDQTSGVNVLLGNHPDANGRLELKYETDLRRQYVDGAASAADGNQRALAAGARWAVTHPAAWLALATRKLGYLFGLEGREHAWAYGHGYFGPRATTTVTAWGVALLIAFPALAVAAVVGAASADWSSRPAVVALVGFIAGTAVLHLASFGESRFHLPLVPALAVLASSGARVREVSPAPAWRWRRAAVAVCVAALVAAWATQLGELTTSLARLRQPDGWTSLPDY
jgi:4-amino-4-deoxy-L-arabinose transferase-like glycosyltransferase